MTEENDGRVCRLYGLRRTGKTIMTLQEIRDLGDYGNTLLVQCEEGDTMEDLWNVLDKELAQNLNVREVILQVMP